MSSIESSLERAAQLQTAAATLSNRRRGARHKAADLAALPPELRLDAAEAYLAALAASAPPLTADQVTRLRSLLPPVRTGQTVAGPTHGQN